MKKENIISLKKEYIEHIGSVLNYSPNTINSYGRDLEFFIKFCNKIKINSISILDEKNNKRFCISSSSEWDQPKIY